ncbi:MAG: hypothetical protein IKG93_04760 [Clostridiales bacterium]|nr:hypothetical protein [Clostridiales bacterium]
MNGKDLLFLMSDADSELIEESEIVLDTSKKQTTNQILILSIAGAVIVGLLIGITLFLKTSMKSKTPSDNNLKLEELSCIIFLNNEEDLEYHSADAADRTRYGLSSDISDVKLSQSDIGDYLGSVSGIKNNSREDIVGKKAYHYSKYPESKSIIIVDIEGSYSLFCSYGYTIDVPLGNSLNDAFAKYGLPEKGVKIEIYNHSDKLVRTITEKSDINKLICIFSDCRNIGYTEQNRRLVQAWHDSYDNDYVYLDEKTGSISFKDITLDERSQKGSSSEKQAGIETGVETGVETISEVSRLPIEDMANELWHKDSLKLIIEVEEGFCIILNYCPVSKTISAFNGAFDLTEEKTESINSFTE